MTTGACWKPAACGLEGFCVRAFPHTSELALSGIALQAMRSER